MLRRLNYNINHLMSMRRITNTSNNSSERQKSKDEFIIRILSDLQFKLDLLNNERREREQEKLNQKTTRKTIFRSICVMSIVTLIMYVMYTRSPYRISFIPQYNKKEDSNI